MQRGQLSERLRAAYRRTGADLPGGDARPTHGAQMEGWFWRFTDRAEERAVVALCGVNRHPDADWATVALAASPGEGVHAGAVDGAVAAADRFEVTVGDVFRADERGVRVDVGGARLEVDVHDQVGWPLRLGAGGLFSVLPYLGQYWQPHVLGGRASGELRVGGETWDLDGADVYAEKIWGAGFPDRWWWGQAQGFADPAICVAFGGGRLTAGPLGFDVTGCVLRLGPEVIRFAPPLARVSADVGQDSWRIRARCPGWRLEVDGHGAGTAPAVLPVPIPAERRNVDRDLEHLTARLRLQVWRRGDLAVDDRTTLAGLEVGTLDQGAIARLAAQHHLPAGAVG